MAISLVTNIFRLVKTVVMIFLQDKLLSELILNMFYCIKRPSSIVYDSRGRIKQGSEL